MIPMTGATGHGVGVIGQLDFYLDDIFPDTTRRTDLPPWTWHSAGNLT